MHARSLTRLAAVVALATACAQRPDDLSQQQAAGQVDDSQAVTLRSPEVSLAAHHDSSPPLFLMTPADRQPPVEHEPKRLPRRPAGHFAALPTAPVQTSVSPLAMPNTLLNFDGVGAGFTGPAGTFSVAAAPPDTNGDVGPNHYVQTVNTDFAVFSKTGTALFGPVPINTLWNGFGGGCQTNNDGDPTVVYDTIADRWVISQFSVSSTPYMQCVAVSQTPDPTGAWNRYAFSYGNTNFTDYPKIGVWPDAYYTTFNVFANGSTFSGAQVCAYDRAKMLAGQPATQQCFSTDSTWGGLLPAALDGARQPPTGSPEYVVAFGTNNLGVWKFHVDWTTPANTTFAGPTLLAVAAFTDACNDGTCIPQAGTSQQLDSLADRLMYRLAYRNFGDHEAMVVNHSVTAGSSVGVRWYELRPDASHNLSVFQQGTYAPDANYRWMGSMAMDQQGNIALGFSLSSSSLTPQIHYTGRLASDPTGQMTQGEATIINGAGAQSGSRGLTRWGDYSMMSIDPSDGCTFWYTTEYIPSTGEFNWATRIGSFKFPGCGGTTTTNDFSISASPSALSLSAGGSGTSTISTAVTSGSAQSVALSASGVPAGASASFTPSSITSGGSSVLTVSAGTAAAGTYTLTITGTGASTTHTASVTLTVASSGTASIAATPSSITIAQGSTGAVTVQNTGTQSVTLALSGVPSGASGSFSATSVSAGGSSTVSINAGTAAAGTSTLTITGTGSSNTATATVSLTVAAAGTNDFSISASPASLSVQQGGAGSSTISTAVASGSAESVALSASGLPSGATASFNPASVTAGGSSALSIAVGASTPAGSYTVTVTGAAKSATHSASIALTVTAATTGGGIVNGGFETGTLSGWSSSGTTAAVSGGHSGSYAAQVGSSSPFNGDSSISQTFTAPSAGGTLSFFYKVVCTDTVTYDWATATLKDNTTGATYTVLANTCSNTGSWSQASAAVTGGHSYTLTLVDHDDGWATDPTYTLYDDVAIGSGSPPPTGGIANGGFETGTFSGWTTSGTTSVVTVAHSGSYAALAGSTSPTNGDSSIRQTFTAPSGASTLGLYYASNCPDTVTYDWVTVTLKDNTAGTTRTLVPKTCAAAYQWTHVTASVTAGHSYTLTLTNHDDDWASDPTYTLFDDVVLQ